MNRTVLFTLIALGVVVSISLGALEIHKTVTIVVEGQAIPVVLWGFKVVDALAAAGIPVYEGDLITPRLEDPILEDHTVLVTRASWVQVTADGDSHTFWTVERRPDLILNSASIQMGADDELLWNGTAINPSVPMAYAPVHSLQLRRAASITLEADGSIQTIQSTAYTLGGALSDAGIRISDSDQVSPSLNTPLRGQDLRVSIQRSQDVIIQTMDQVIRTRVLGATVGDALMASGLALQGSNFSIPPDNHPIPPDGKIRVVHVQDEITLEQELIPFPTQFQPSAQVDLDAQQVIQVGEFGITVRRMRVVYQNDQEISRSVEDEWVAKEPTPRIIGYGTKISIRTVNTPDGPVEYWRAVDAYATSYSPCRIGIPDKCSNRTASGAELKKGVIGVTRSWYNNLRGSLVYIPGYGFATVEDIGAGFSDRHWVDLGYSDNDFVKWSGYVTVYFVAPAPLNPMYILE